METAFFVLGAALLAVLALLAAAYLFWRCYWFWRNPPRTVPRGDHVLSPADGTVVYVKRAAPHEPIISCKQGRAVSINDIAREELGQPKILVGIFMSPFGVHYNRAPIAARLDATKEYPAEEKNLHMGSMHWRCMLHKLPIYANSPHIVQNNRRVTRFRGKLKGEDTSCYVVQIGGGSVHGIDVYPEIGASVEQGAIFGMIRIGSQVDLIVPDLPELEINVAPGDRVVAGETIVIA
ncbi:MAG: phosphatidylserine decarboxylase [Thermoguttaceae bacterium]